MAYKKKTAKEKLADNKDLPRSVKIPAKMEKQFGKGKMLIPRPLDVDAAIKKIKKGKLATPFEIREKLSKDAKTATCCPLVTGIFTNIVAFAAEEDRAAGKKNITPYWRVVKEKGKLNEKFPQGVQNHAKLLKAEGFTIEPGKGKQPPHVKDFEKYLTKL
jgi:hypothetical protein